MWFYVLCPVFFPLLCFILALLWHLEMKDLWKIRRNKKQHPCSCCYGNRVIIWERVSHPSIWTGCCLPRQITYYCLCRAADKVMYYRKTIKKMRWRPLKSHNMQVITHCLQLMALRCVSWLWHKATQPDRPCQGSGKLQLLHQGN